MQRGWRWFESNTRLSGRVSSVAEHLTRHLVAFFSDRFHALREPLAFSRAPRNVAQSGQRTRFGAEGPQVQILPFRCTTMCRKRATSWFESEHPHSWGRWQLVAYTFIRSFSWSFKCRIVSNGRSAAFEAESLGSSPSPATCPMRTSWVTSMDENTPSTILSRTACSRPVRLAVRSPLFHSG